MSAADAIREIQELANALAAAEEQLADLRTRVERADKELARAEGERAAVPLDAERLVQIGWQDRGWALSDDAHKERVDAMRAALLALREAMGSDEARDAYLRSTGTGCAPLTALLAAFDAACSVAVAVAKLSRVVRSGGALDTLDEVIEDALRFRALPQLDDATVEAYARLAHETWLATYTAKTNGFDVVVSAVLTTFMARATSEEAMDDVTAPAIVRAALAYACTDLPVVDATEPLRFPGFKDAPADAELAEVKPEKRETFEPIKLPDLRCDWSNTHIDRAADFGNPPDVSEMMREANAFRAAFHAIEAEINRMRGDIARLGARGGRPRSAFARLRGEAEASEWRRATLEHLTEQNRMLGKILREVRGGK